MGCIGHHGNKYEAIDKVGDRHLRAVSISQHAVED